MRVPVPLHAHQHLLFSIFMTRVILIGMKWYLTVVLICIILMTNDVEHCTASYWPFTCIVYLLWWKSLSNPLPIFKCVAFLLLSCKNYLYILDTRPLSDIWFATIFLHSVDYLSLSWWCPLYLNLMRSNLFIFFFCSLCFL